MATFSAKAASAESSSEPENGSSGSGRSTAAGSRNAIVSGFTRLEIMRQLGLMAGLAASVAIGFAVVLWSRGESFQPLYANMQGYNVGELIETLEFEGIDYKIEPSTGVVLVESGSVASVRLTLAAAGISRDTGYGYESLDVEQGLGTSQFMESNRYKRSQEGELQRTIASFNNIQSARVHLATPERSVFVRNSRKPTASVFLAMYSGRQLGQSQVAAIANLVASSIPELSPEDVTIVDEQGNLLSRKDDDSDLAIAGKQFDYARRYEESLIERINGILRPIVGSEGFRAEVTVDLDFTRTEQAAEIFNPENAAIRSEQTMEERGGQREASGIPGAASNQVVAAELVGGETAQPQLDPAAEEQGEAENVRIQSTRNYELDRTISYTNSDPVALRRLSVALVLDDRPGADGQMASWTEEEVERIRTLVSDAVGYSAARGDSVTVINNRFAPVTPYVADEPSIWRQPWVASTAKQVAAAAVVILLVLGVLRPVLRNLAVHGGKQKQLRLASSEGEFADLNMDEESMYDDTVTLSGGDDILLPGPSESYERQLNAIKGLIADDPGRVAQVVKGWITEDDWN